MQGEWVVTGQNGKGTRRIGGKEVVSVSETTNSTYVQDILLTA